MVQTYQSSVRVYKYPFELIMAAYEKRFPRCPQTPIVVNCEILSQDESENGAVQVTKRRCKLKVEAPYLLKKISGIEHIYFLQKNTLNRLERTLEIEIENECFPTRLKALEKCKYYVHPENANWTCFEQSCNFEVKSFYNFESLAEEIAMKLYIKNISKGTEIIEFHINELKSNGITSIPIWKEPKKDAVESKASGDSPHAKLTTSRSVDKSAQFHLEYDYILRYLGELDTLQESRLVQLKNHVNEFQKGKTPSDATLLRFLRARNFNVDKAKEMLAQSLLWRKKYQVDRILSEYEIPQVVKDYFPGSWHFNDTHGRPVFVLRLGQLDAKGLLKSIGEEGLLKLVLHICEEGLKLLEEATEKEGKPISMWSLLIDADGLNMRHMWRPGIKALLRIIECVETNYPETMAELVLVRTPRAFSILWAVISAFIDSNTKRKIVVSSGSESLELTQVLGERIPEQFIPTFLGGKCDTKILNEGGLIPKSLYMSNSWCEKEHSIYQSFSLSKGQVFEKCVVNQDPGSVLTWDFDVICQNVAFTIFRTNHPIHLNGSSVAGPTSSLTKAESEPQSFIENSWVENRDYCKAENTVVYHDGESVQGSHIMENCATYILQWKFHCDHPVDLIDSIITQKAKVMFFYETLTAANYKGSMTSLQSINSKLSNISSNQSAEGSCASR